MRKEREIIPSFNYNPFEIKGLKEVVKSYKDEIPVVNPETGELYAMRKLQGNNTKSSVMVDTQTFYKVYSGVVNVAIEHFTLPEWKMWFYCLKQLAINKDTIVINIKECKNTLGWKSLNSVYDSIRGLVEKEVLAKCSFGSSIYWINANYFFNGDRTKIKTT